MAILEVMLMLVAEAMGQDMVILLMEAMGGMGVTPGTEGMGGMGVTGGTEAMDGMVMEVLDGMAEMDGMDILAGAIGVMMVMPIAPAGASL